MQSEDVYIVWSTTSEEYCCADIDNVDKIIDLNGTQPLKVFGTKAGKRPFLAPCRPEIDVKKVLGNDIQYIYLQLIVLLR